MVSCFYFQLEHLFAEVTEKVVKPRWFFLRKNYWFNFRVGKLYYFVQPNKQ